MRNQPGHRRAQLVDPAIQRADVSLHVAKAPGRAPPRKESDYGEREENPLQARTCHPTVGCVTDAKLQLGTLALLLNDVQEDF